MAKLIATAYKNLVKGKDLECIVKMQVEVNVVIKKYIKDKEDEKYMCIYKMGILW